MRMSVSEMRCNRNYTKKGDIVAKIGTVIPSDESWAQYACVPNPKDACFTQQFADTKLWCNWGIYGCPSNMTECKHLGLMKNKCECKPGYHIPINKSEDFNQHNIVGRQNGSQCVPVDNTTV